MAAISDVYTWFSIVPATFANFPVKAGSDKHNIVITNGQHLICVVQVADQQTIKSWSAKQLFSFTCPAIFNPVQNQFCVVQNDHLLRLWTDDCESLMSSQKIKFTEKIHSILDFDHLEPVIVFFKGDCQTLSKAIETKKDNKHNYILQDDISWVAGYYDDISYYIVIVSTEKESSERSLHWMSITKSIGVVDKHKSKLLKKDQAFPLSWCLQQGREKAPLHVLWSDGELHRYDYENFTSKCLLNLSSTVSNCSVTTCSLNNSYIAIVSVPKNKDFQDPVLEIWNVDFSIMKEKRVLPFLTEDVQINYVGSVLFLLTAKELKGMYCNLLPSSLASVVGSALPLMRGSNDKKELVVRWTSQEMNNDVEDVNMEEEKFPDLLEMELTGQTLPRLCEQLFTKLRDKSDIGTLANALEHWNHIPEKELAKTLQFCLSARSEIFAKYLKFEASELEEEDCPFSYHKALFVNKLLCLPFNDVFIHKHLQSIPFQHVMELLQYLLFLLKLEERIESMGRRPSVQMISSWLCILFDVHFSNFILSKDEKVNQLILDLRDATKIMLQLYRDLDNLEELLIFAQEKLRSAQSRPPSLYCIEMLCI